MAERILERFAALGFETAPASPEALAQSEAQLDSMLERRRVRHVSGDSVPN